jgi:hypothetical protein
MTQAKQTACLTDHTAQLAGCTQALAGAAASIAAQVVLHLKVANTVI